MSKYTREFTYLSLFSGIGAFEYSMKRLYPNARCVGFSEIDKDAEMVYNKHYPLHKNLGDITNININKVEACDLIVGGFPCQNLSSIGKREGLSGPKSNLFFELVKIITAMKKKNKYVQFIIENVGSMSIKNQDEITSTLKNIDTIYHEKIDNSIFGVQTRKRIFWTNFPFEKPGKEVKCTQTWDDILLPFEEVKKYVLTPQQIEIRNKLRKKGKQNKTRIMVETKNVSRYKFKTIHTEQELSRWQIYAKSDTMLIQMYVPYPVGKSKPITCSTSDNVVLDRRGEMKGFTPRNFTQTEIERLFGLPDGYTKQIITKTHWTRLLGNSIPTFLTDYILQCYIPPLCPVDGIEEDLVGDFDELVLEKNTRTTNNLLFEIFSMIIMINPIFILMYIIYAFSSKK